MTDIKNLRNNLRASGDLWLERIAAQLTDAQLRRLGELVNSGVADEIRATNRPGDHAAIVAEETGMSYGDALVFCNMD